MLVCAAPQHGHKDVPHWNKADDRTRTDNLLITNQLLCQLSHIGKIPSADYKSAALPTTVTFRLLSGIEPHRQNSIPIHGGQQPTIWHNGAYRARTYDPLLVRQMLSQLS